MVNSNHGHTTVVR